MWTIIEQFTDFNTHCCPKIRLRGWQKASRCTLVISRRALAREGDYEMMPVCACVRACVRVCVR